MSDNNEYNFINEDASYHYIYYDKTEHIAFTGPCTCEHDKSEHGFVNCNIMNCDCEAYWKI